MSGRTIKINRAGVNEWLYCDLSEIWQKLYQSPHAELAIKHSWYSVYLTLPNKGDFVDIKLRNGNVVFGARYTERFVFEDIGANKVYRIAPYERTQPLDIVEWKPALTAPGRKIAEKNKDKGFTTPCAESVKYAQMTNRVPRFKEIKTLIQSFEIAFKGIAAIKNKDEEKHLLSAQVHIRLVVQEELQPYFFYTEKESGIMFFAHDAHTLNNVTQQFTNFSKFAITNVLTLIEDGNSSIENGLKK